MKRFLILVSLFCLCTVAHAAQYFEAGVNYSGISTFSDSIVYIDSGAIVSSTGNNIIMNEPVYLYNSGHIDGTINTNGNTLVVYNSGLMNGGINPNGGLVKQVITAPSEITNIGMPMGQSPVVAIENYDNFDFNNLDSINAQSFIITDSSIVMDNFSDWQMCPENIELNGNVSLIINNPDSVNSGEVIKYTKSGTRIFVKINKLDKMYKPVLKVSNGGIVLDIVRETDYSVIFGNGNSDEDKRNTALETIRDNHPNDKLLKALDAADNLGEIKRLENLSYRFNHGILLRPIKMITKFSMSDLITNEKDLGVGVIPYYIMSDKMDAVDGHLYIGHKHDNLYFYAGVNLNKFEYSDELNDFSGLSYGMDFQSRQTFDKFWINEVLGFSLTSFKADYISMDGKIKNNPLGFSWYGDLSVGYDFNTDENIILTPIMGLSYQPYNIADVSETDSFVHIGADAKYFFVVDGIKYEYVLSAAYGTNGDLFANLKIGFTSVMDEAGVSLNTGVLKDDFDYHYKISLNAKVMF